MFCFFSCIFLDSTCSRSAVSRLPTCWDWPEGMFISLAGSAQIFSNLMGYQATIVVFTPGIPQEWWLQTHPPPKKKSRPCLPPLQCAETCVAWVSFCQMAIFWLLVMDPSRCRRHRRLNFAVEMPTSCNFCNSTMMLIHHRQCKSFECRVFLSTTLTCYLAWVLLSSPCCVWISVIWHVLL